MTPPASRPRIKRAAAMLALVIAGEAVFGLPFLVARVFRPTLLDVFGLTNLQLGTAFSVYGGCAMVAYLPGGPLADRFSTRGMMTLALLGTAIGGLVYIQIPSAGSLTLLFGFWGLTTILLFWSPLIRATRAWGGSDAPGRAFGILDAGRGLFAAALGSASLAVFARQLPGDARTASLADRTAALQGVIAWVTAATVLAAALVWWAVRPEQKLGPAPRALRTGAKLRLVCRNRSVWLQALIVLSAYTGYKSLDDYSLFARDAFGFDDVAAAKVGTFTLWVRPLAAFAAGSVGDRVGVTRMVVVCFAAVSAGHLAVALGVLEGGQPWMLFAAVATTSTLVFALRSLYFALFEDANVDPCLTGTAAGVVSMVGYLPDVFVAPVNGFLTDTYPGAAGHRLFFGCVAAVSAAGLLSTLAFDSRARARG